MSKRCELQKEYYQTNGNYKGNGKYCDKYVSWLEDQILALRIHDVCGSSILIPKPKLKFEGLDNISIVGENDILLSELFELHIKLENYLKSRPESIVNVDGKIVGFKNYR